MLNKVAGLTLLYLIGITGAAAQDVGSTLATDEAKSCAALSRLNLEAAPGGPAVISSARLVDVSTTGLDGGPRILGGFGGNVRLRASQVKLYCNVTGYAAPQNKFELRLPLPMDRNHNFLFIACGGFCGGVDGTDCNLGLARGYASVTSNGGHDGNPGFDGTWAANAPNAGPYVDPSYFLEAFTSKPGASSGSDWADAGYDGMVESAAATHERMPRFRKLTQAEGRLLRALPIIPMFTFLQPVLAKPFVKGLGTNLLDRQQFKYLWIDQNWSPS